MKILFFTLFLFGIFGVIYPASVTLFGYLFFKRQAEGSLLKNSQGQVIGSELLGQTFYSPRYFQGRDALNLETFQDKIDYKFDLYLVKRKFFRNHVNEKILSLKKLNDPLLPIPIDLVTFSASGLDPHISQEGAHYQVKRIALTRNIPEYSIHSLIQKESKGRDYVNVLKLNIELDNTK